MHILVKVSCVTLHGAMYIRLHSVSIYMQTTLRMQCTTYQDNCLYNVCSSRIQAHFKMQCWVRGGYGVYA